MPHIVLRLGFACLLGSALLGCSQGVKKITVNGTVTYKGQPLESGILQFVGADGAYSAAVVQPGGKFIMTDVVPGDIKVGVQSSPGGSGSSDPKAAAAPKGPTPATIPEKYRNPETSGLKYTVTPSTDTLEIKLD
ncbi:hypothetical protein GobsT_38860 [Gemmata obscuriglobus]|uniref:Carboxypeptidase regulatory-like domain-containing protein n=1 Tax=Gemmata obscuriglobus TaxID=114 RepID=A0A2Z3H8J9_9BACT|nr:hypothetical protein [Gemmata obscuriglobus]AWM38034.1 hypothetical protein C1280_14220 [Gemmata obscuriglobus]QEG29097.1 hypothetical protein GobsT_38860 [Gemmata obscuriglobus]VTS07769.1 Uncharacterized protein OS=Blastopirellula marina DSM 3645 GN=DSM3645_26634 PE=4 SV=1 [Gemmata obscuriglobus UQM 2246]